MPRTPTQARFCLVLLMMVGACGHAAPAERPATNAAATKPAPASAASEPAPATQQSEPEPSAAHEPITNFMGEHFAITDWARATVIAGQLEDLAEPLSALAAYRYESVEPGGWEPWIAQLQAAARLTAEAQTLDAAAVGVATMARICGECHKAMQRGPAYEPLVKLARRRTESLPERMIRHEWAMDSLWDGLTTPSDEAWNAGVRALSSRPNDLDRHLSPEFAKPLEELRVLTIKAGEASTLADRADVYGLMLATCAQCHSHLFAHE